MTKLRFLLYNLFLTLTVSAVSAGIPADSARVYFRQSKTALLPDYKDNGASLERLAEELTDTTPRIAGHVRVVGSASPEGSVLFNRYLSETRARRIFDWFSERDLIPADSTMFTFTGRNWAGLLEMVKADPQVPARGEVIELLDGIVAGAVPDDNEALTRLKGIGGGEPYLYMYHRLFPALRASWIYVDYSQPALPAIHSLVPATTAMTEIASSPELPEIAPRFPHRKPFYMALKTNMLYDALAIPSIGAEFYLGKNFSIVGNWYYGWWKNDHVHRYWRAYGGDVAVRYWLGEAAHRKPLTGHHIGLYGGIVTYDVEFGGKGYMGGDPGRTLWDRFNTMAGVEYGYSLPVGRRLNIDFTIGVGYLGGRIVKYEPAGPHYLWLSTKNFSWFGPTKAEISLTWLIGSGNVNKFERRNDR